MIDGSLSLRILGEGGGTNPYDVVARIERLAPHGADMSALDLIVPSSGEGLKVPLQAGSYNVQLFLASGRVLQQAFEMEAGASVPLTFQEPSAGFAGFSLQAASGVVSLADILEEAVSDRPRSEATISLPRTTSNGRVAASKTVPSTVTSRGAVGGRVGSRTARFAAGGLRPQQTVAARVGSSHSRTSDLAKKRAEDRKAPRTGRTTERPVGLGLAPKGTFDGMNSWRILSDGPSSWSSGGKTWLAPDADEVQPGASIWRLAPDVVRGDAAGTRVWGLVRGAKGLEAVSIPAPWRRVDGGFSPVDILVDARLTGRASTSVAIHDAEFDGLLTYFDRGRLAALRPMIAALERNGSIERRIYGRMANPLAACAAAYVGLAVSDPDEQDRWTAWLPDIVRLFPWLPDCAIVNARHMILRPGAAEDGALIMAALEQAYEAGVPYYSAGLLLMREMLEILATDHPRAATLLNDVGPIAARCDPKQMFTVLRYPEAKQ
ncbi:hypothetical protein HMP09_1913 [Sphingomonas sp. HMP9]|uniref:hypothetical protein n=1 Tax=Sphingomonas sp. HMP9 TaxID=1517554 RepID=UPI0015964CBA|nr:hypothetical protein [Sphingomonas sp. HMP9]BCA62679.1 hypothetical protein HMP09_1913 [Sphingomonas sp. HMP9]